MTNLLTRIDALDAMIFGDPYDSPGPSPKPRGFAPGEVVLIRGEPGAGKTTLALQIAANLVHTGVNVLFVTVEEPKDRLAPRIPTARGDGSVFWIERDQVADLVRPPKKPDSQGASKRGVRAAATATATAEALKLAFPGLAALVTIAAPDVEKALERLFAAVVTTLRKWSSKRRNGAVMGPDLLIIDSLNAFMSLLLTLYAGTDPRLLLGQICERLRREVGGNTARPVILLTGEYHFGNQELERHLPESFFCDTEIVLRTEPLRAARHQVLGDRVTLGYELAALVEHRAKSVESRSFCRVLKCRGAPNQARRCAYDIGDGGLRFYETYPGDGKLLLFAENEQQRERWQSFLQRDLTDAYPALRYELFTMKTLQSVYESTRRLGHVPLRTDMYLASLDSYWVTGYRDYRLKRYVNEKLHDLMEEHGVESTTFFSRDGLQRVIPDERNLRARQVRALRYPELLNDLLRYCLLRLEDRLYSSTVRELSRQFLPREQDGKPLPIARLRTLTGKVLWATRMAGEHVAALGGEYDELCQELFGMDIAVLVKLLEPGLSLRQTFLRPLPRSKLELYGQYNGALLRSLRREDMHEYVGGDDHWMCVPYDANIGVFVVRKDLLRIAQMRANALAKAFTRLKIRECKIWAALDVALEKGDFDRILDRAERFGDTATGVKGELARCADEMAKASLQARRMLDTAKAFGNAPADPVNRLDWDTVLSLSIAGRHALGIETRTFDTFMAFFLELVWNSGGRLNVDAGYRIRRKEELLVSLVRALHYFVAIFDLTETPRDQTVDPSLTPSAGAAAYGEWLFGRFWYSTLVDALTARAGGERGEFVWRSPAAVEIVPMPKGSSAMDVGNFACWGEWSFALLAGSENVELACDLVSNLMGAFKVSDRGLRSAALPTVSQFYEQFGEQRCVAADLRPDLKLPSMTFRELRSLYLEPQRATKPIAPEEQIFRQYIFDYRHCARVIYAALLSLKDPPKPLTTEKQSADAVVSAALGILTGIEKLRETYLFVGDTFRHDVIQTQQHRRIQREYPRRPPRQTAAATLLAKAGRFQVEIVDISRGGCRLRAQSNSRLGFRAVHGLEVDNGGAMGATRRWDREIGGSIELGLEFEKTLDRPTWLSYLDS